MDKKNLGVVRQYFASVVWTHKIHMKCHEILREKNNRIKVYNILLISSVLLCHYLQHTLPHNYQELASFIGGILTVFEVVLLVYTLSFNFGEMALKHQLFADDLKNIRDDYLALIADIMNERAINIEEARDKIKGRLSILSKYLPEQEKHAEAQATIALGVDPKMQTGDYTYSDEEIDIFLPEELKIGNL